MNLNVADADNHLLIHLSAAKSEFYRRSPAIFWSEQLRSWITADPDTMQAIQKNPLFRVPDHAAETDKITSRLNIDLRHIARVFRTVPVNVEGAEHAARRRRMAHAIAARTEDGLARFTRLACSLCERHLGRPGQSELVTGLFEPLVLELAHALSGITVTHNPDFVSPTQVFDRSLGLNRRKLIDERIGRLWHQARESMSDDDADMAVALALLGTDTILGSLALTFAERVSASPETRMCDVDWGDRVTATAVPFIERTATAPVHLAGVDIRQGDLVRLFLDSLSLEPVERRDAYFGVGRHACLGRPVSQQAWRALAAVLAELPLTVRIDSVRLREADCMFLFPREMTVTTHGP
jgi:cytochrome P450